MRMAFMGAGIVFGGLVGFFINRTEYLLAAACFVGFLVCFFLMPAKGE